MKNWTPKSKIKSLLSQKFQQMQKVKKIVLFSVIAILSSCVPKKDIVYFQNDKIDQEKFSNSYKTVIKPADLLQITVSSVDLEAAKPFNLPAVAYSTTTNNIIGTPRQQEYLVDNNGNIDFPVLGSIKVGGLSRQELIQYLKKRLVPDYIKNPTIIVRISNFSVTILGDVKKPGTYTIPNERITVLQAIGLASDLNISGKRNIQVKREEAGKIKTYDIDLRSNTLFTSPAYYLQQNDIVYVQPNRAASQSASYNQNTGLFISIGSVLVALISVLTR
ncbi:Polysaccharide export outer membrane protein [Tenacibaculum litopenaei]|uniref:polysaccharide biosynthesis/export family protein n=1 Tax=Tenacibaculum litopenaei TaxID=396016 RepID=UPI00389496BC